MAGSHRKGQGLFATFCEEIGNPQKGILHYKGVDPFSTGGKKMSPEIIAHSPPIGADIFFSDSKGPPGVISPIALRTRAEGPQGLQHHVADGAEAHGAEVQKQPRPAPSARRKRGVGAKRGGAAIFGDLAQKTGWSQGDFFFFRGVPFCVCCLCFSVFFGRGRGVFGTKDLS